MHSLALALALLLSLFLADVRELGFATSGTNVTLTTTSETVVISSGPVTVPSETCTVVILGWAQLTTGTATTAVTPRIRQGSAVTGTLVGEANAVTIGAAAGSTEVFTVLVSESRSAVADVEYSLTLQQTAATANGTALQAGILVLII